MVCSLVLMGRWSRRRCGCRGFGCCIGLLPYPSKALKALRQAGTSRGWASSTHRGSSPGGNGPVQGMHGLAYIVRFASRGATELPASDAYKTSERLPAALASGPMCPFLQYTHMHKPVPLGLLCSKGKHMACTGNVESAPLHMALHLRMG